MLITYGKVVAHESCEEGDLKKWMKIVTQKSFTF
jgi:hypothetical protein